MRIRNKLTFLLYFTIFALLFLFFSCSTVDKVIPGKDEAADKSITAEYIKIAEAYEQLKDYPKAISYYEQAMKSKAGAELGDSAYYNIGRCYALAKDWNHAEEIYKNLLEKDPDNTNLKSSLAYINAMKGDLKTAAEQYSALVQENPTDSSLLKNLISVLLADNKKAEAEKQFGIFKVKFPDDSAVVDIEKLFAPKDQDGLAES
ncbi:MAG: tetratricopeptide repeat protein [Treponema sp.]|nr:tetratricopeptide repeat protein [Treponema sp.]